MRQQRTGHGGNTRTSTSISTGIGNNTRTGTSNNTHIINDTNAKLTNSLFINTGTRASTSPYTNTDAWKVLMRVLMRLLIFTYFIILFLRILKIIMIRMRIALLKPYPDECAYECQ